MPGQAGELTEAEILAVVCHERYTLGGADRDLRDGEFDNWCAEDSPACDALEPHTSLAWSAEAGVIDAEGEPIETCRSVTRPIEGARHVDEQTSTTKRFAVRARSGNQRLADVTTGESSSDAND